MSSQFTSDLLITNILSVDDSSHHRVYRGYDVILVKANFTCIDNDFEEKDGFPAFAVGRDGFIFCVCPSYPTAVKLINAIILGKGGDNYVNTP